MRLEWNGRTANGNNPIYEIREGKSVLEGCINKKELWIWVIISRKKGDMKKMINYLVKETNITKIRFLNALSPSLLISKLKGFTLTRSFNPQIEEYQEDLVGVWKL